MNKFFADPRTPEHLTVRERKINFSDELVRRCILVVIAGANESYSAAKKLWKRGFGAGRERGRIPYPDFGRYVDLHTFQAFKIAIPRMWADEIYWYAEYGFEQWEMIDHLLRNGIDYNFTYLL